MISEIETFFSLKGIKEYRYLSDGVYVGFDGHSIVLATQRFEGVHYIYLEPREFMQLLFMVKEVSPKIADYLRMLINKESY